MSTSPASTSTLGRYRPALLAITAIAAGYAVYLVHDKFWGHPTALHRCNAIHGRPRRRVRAGQRAQPHPPITQNLNANDLREIFVNELAQILQSSSQSDGSMTYIPLSREGTAAVQRYLSRRSSDAEEDNSDERRDYERAIVRAFLCARVPPDTLLIDEGGHEAFVEAFISTGSLTQRDVVSSVLLAFNIGGLEHSEERLAFYRSLGVTPLNPRDQQDDPLTEREVSGMMDEVIERGQATNAESEHSWMEEEEREDIRGDGQSLLNMLYHIAEDQSKKDGYIHRGVGCNSCGTHPIRGVRYHCTNCLDYDLCEQCESQQQHIRTHVFLKIRIPAPVFEAEALPQPPPYPGSFGTLPSQLSHSVARRLSEECGREHAEVEAMWDHFKCLANEHWATDPLGVDMAINREVFDRCFLDFPIKGRRPPTLPIHDRIFAFFDTDRNGLIGFHEFIMGIATIRTKDRRLKLRRIFDCYDMDGDGFIRRRDFVRLFRSYYFLTREITRDAILNMEEDIMDPEILRDTLRGSQPISAAFMSNMPQPQYSPPGGPKVRNMQGDLVASDGGGALAKNDLELEDRNNIIRDAAETLFHKRNSELLSILEMNVTDPMADGLDNQHPLSTRPWPPQSLQASLEDARTALGRDVGNIVEITDVRERYRLIQTVVEKRIKAVRDSAVSSRKLREERLSIDHSQPTLPSQDPNPPSLQGRVPPPLEVDAGQEYLYQIMDESLNEILDPLFKFREDISIESQLRREECQELLKLPGPAHFNSDNFREMCELQLKNVFRQWYRAGSTCGITTNLNLGADISQELKEFLRRQEDIEHKEWIPNLRNLFTYNLMSEEEFELRTMKLKEHRDELATHAQYPDAQDTDGESSSVDGEAASSRANSNEEARIGLTEQSTPPSMIPYIPKEIDIREILQFPSAGDTNGGPGEHPVEQPLETLLASAGYVVDESLPLAQHSRGDANADMPDPTLPQNRPNGSTGYAGKAALEPAAEPPALTQMQETPVKHVESVPTANGRAQEPEQEPEPEPESSYVHWYPPLDGSEPASASETRQRWKYLIMLDVLAEEDSKRRGPGALNYEEFVEVMTGVAQSRLEFFGMFYELVRF